MLSKLKVYIHRRLGHRYIYDRWMNRKTFKDMILQHLDHASKHYRCSHENLQWSICKNGAIHIRLKDGHEAGPDTK